MSSASSHHPPGAAPAHSHTKDTASVTDPVCGMKVNPANARYSAEHAGHRYFFCSQACQQKFQAEPGRYLAAADGPSASMPAATEASAETSADTGAGPTIYLPDASADQAGSAGQLPHLRTVLEPATAVADEGPSPELAEISRRFWISLD